MQMSNSAIIIESEATMFALSANAPRSYRYCIGIELLTIDRPEYIRGRIIPGVKAA